MEHTNGVDPTIFGLTVFVLATGTFVLDRTRFGRHLYAVGGSAEAARRAGIKVSRIRISAFVITSSLACLSGLLHVSRLGGVEATAGRQIVLSGVAAAVVGIPIMKTKLLAFAISSFPVPVAP